MSRADLTRAALEALRCPPEAGPGSLRHGEALQLRDRVLGALIRKFRQDAALSPADCAEGLQLAPQDIEAWELGEASPGLPQVELLDALFSGRGGDRWNGDGEAFARDEFLLLRQRVIGLRLRRARQENDLDLRALSERAGLDPATVERYELGELRIPMSKLAILAGALDLDPRLLAEQSPAQAREDESGGEDDGARVGVAADADEDRAFIRLAMAFRGIERDDLHRIAEALFGIIQARESAHDAGADS